MKILFNITTVKGLMTPGPVLVDPSAPLEHPSEIFCGTTQTLRKS